MHVMENDKKLLEQGQQAYDTGYRMVETFQEADPDFAKPLGQSLPEQYRTEVLSYLLFLSEVSGNVNARRAEFIDTVLGYPYSDEELSELLRRLALHDQDFASLIPTSLKAAVAYDNRTRGQNAALTIIRVYDRLGDAFRSFALNDSAMEELDQRIYILSLNNWARENGMPLSQSYNRTGEPPRFHPAAEQPESKEKLPPTPAAAQPAEKSLEELMAELNALVGLEKVKEDVSSLVNLLKIKKLRKERHMSDIEVSMHLVFTGNPGTGKTTVARLLASIYHALGALSQGQLVEVERSDLVGGYVGQTAIKTNEVIEKALGGVLFIDEAYSLTSGKDPSDFGYEAVNTLLVEMENHRDDLVVIVAGYPELMESFLRSNPGLKSRFNKFISFADYKPDQLFEILKGMIKKNGYVLHEKDSDSIKAMMTDLYDHRDENFANGRTVRNFFEKAMVRQANRLAKKDEITNEELQSLILEDFIDPSDSKETDTHEGNQEL